MIFYADIYSKPFNDAYNVYIFSIITFIGNNINVFYKISIYCRFIIFKAVGKRLYRLLI